MMSPKDILLGYEVGTGKPILIPARHLAVTGQTQESGKTTTLEALVTRSGVTALTFITKRGESSFDKGRRIPPYFRDRADWQFVTNILDAQLQEKNKFLRPWIIKLCSDTQTLADVQRKVRAKLPTAKGINEGVYTQLDAYLDLIVPEIKRARLAPTLDLRPGLNVMDVSAFSTPMQMLFIQSAIDWVNDHCTKTVVVVPEAWEFIPEGKGSPVKASAVALVRKGAGIGNYIWVDSQDTAGVDKTILRGCSVFLLGVQREANEIKRNLANVPAGIKRPTAAAVATLERGQFFACWSTHCVKTYVRPAWASEKDAIATAIGTLDRTDRPEPTRPLTEGYVVKGGRNVAPSQVTKRPVPPASMSYKQEAQVNEEEAHALRQQNADLKRRIAILENQSSKTHQRPDNSAPLNDDFDSFYEAFKRRAESDPSIIALLTTVPEIEVTVTRPKIVLDDTTLTGRLAAMIANGFFDLPTTASAASTDLDRRGIGSSKPNVYKACDRLTTMGFLVHSNVGYQAVASMKINLVEG